MLWARSTILFTCTLNFNWLSIITPKSFTVATMGSCLSHNVNAKLGFSFLLLRSKYCVTFLIRYIQLPLARPILQFLQLVFYIRIITSIAQNWVNIHIISSVYIIDNIERLLRTRTTFSKSVMVSVGVLVCKQRVDTTSTCYDIISMPIYTTMWHETFYVVWNMMWFLRLTSVIRGKFELSQGSVATCLRCGGIFNYHYAANLPLSMSVKEFWKSVKKWQSYSHEFGVFLFSGHGVYATVLSVAIAGMGLHVDTTVHVFS